VQDFEKRNTVILGISFDSQEANLKFAEKQDFPFLLLCDTDKSIGIAYGAADASSRTPKRISYLIDEDGKILKAYAKVSPAAHPQEVLSDLTT